MLKACKEIWLKTLVETDKNDPKFAACLMDISSTMISCSEEIDRLKEELYFYKRKLKEEVERELAGGNTNPVLKAPIKECGLPLYVANDLYYCKYEFSNLGEVLRFTRKEILAIRGFGGKRMAVLEGFLEEHGLKFIG